MAETKATINKRFVDSLKYSDEGQNIYFDNTLPGFALRVFKSCKTYVVQARVGGKVIRRTVGKHGHFTAEQARTEAQSLLGLMAKQKDPITAKKELRTQGSTLEELFAIYLEKRDLRPKTVIIYKDVMRRCLPDWQNKPVKALTREMVETRLTEVSNANTMRGKGEAQAGQVYRLLRSLMKFANEEFEVEGKPFLVADPTRNLSRGRPWTTNVRRQGVVQKHQLADWFKAVFALTNTTVRDYLLLTMLTGLRRNEGLKLKWADIDLDGNYLTIDGSLAKNHQEHRLPLSDYLQTILKERKEIWQSKSEYVFPGNNDRSHLKEPKRMLKKVAQESGVNFMLHDLRRTFTTVAEGLDIPSYTLKKLINHSTKNDVTGGYIVTGMERLREPMQRITDFILAQAGIN